MPNPSGISNPNPIGSPPGDVVQQATPQDIWNLLEQAGASAVQAAGIMGNAIAESSLDPEANVVDSNGARSYGLWQFNADTYPNAGTLVTGNPLADAKAQIVFLAQNGGFTAAQGSTPAQSAANFAANFERCQTCQAGGASNTARQANAGTVAGWAASGNWPAQGGQASDTATLGAATTAAQTASCMVGWPGIFGLGEFCLLSRSQARALLSGSILVAGGLLALFGVAALLGTTSAGQQAAGVLMSVVPAGRVAAAGAAVGA